MKHIGLNLSRIKVLWNWAKIDSFSLDPCLLSNETNCVCVLLLLLETLKLNVMYFARIWLSSSDQFSIRICDFMGGLEHEW